MLPDLAELYHILLLFAASTMFNRSIHLFPLWYLRRGPRAGTDENTPEYLQLSGILNEKRLRLSLRGQADTMPIFKYFERPRRVTSIGKYVSRPPVARAWSPDGRRIVSASSDNTLRIWDADSGQGLRTLSGHENSVWGCAWSPDGRRIVSVSSDGTLRLWDVQRGRELDWRVYMRGTYDGAVWATVDHRANPFSLVTRKRGAYSGGSPSARHR
jgi:WD40 repeat protein